MGKLTVYYWRANHIAVKLDDDKSTGDGTSMFRAFSHDDENYLPCDNGYLFEDLQDLYNTYYDNTKIKDPGLIDDYWADCSNYIREDQKEILKAVFELMIRFYAFDDDEDIEEDSKEEEIAPDVRAMMDALGTKSTSDLKKDAIEKAREYPILLPLVEELTSSLLTAVTKKHILLSFLNKLKSEKGLLINIDDETDEDIMYGKAPIQEWELPIGGQVLDSDSDFNPKKINFFGIHALGIKTGTEKFEDPDSFVHRIEKKLYYKFFSRYHNCSGYVRYLLEQGGITCFGSTNALERWGVTDPQKYEAYISMVCGEITKFNSILHKLISEASIVIEEEIDLTQNYLDLFKKELKEYDILPSSLKTLLDEYNTQQTDVSYEYKIELLKQIVIQLDGLNEDKSELLHAVQAEIRRNYAIPFDAQFSYNHYFQLNCLIASSVISIAALAVGAIAIAFPPLIPICLAAAIAITATSGVVGIASVTSYCLFSSPKIPPSKTIAIKECKEEADGHEDLDSNEGNDLVSTLTCSTH